MYYDDHGLIGNYLKYYDDLCSWFTWSMIIYIYMWSNVNVCVLSMNSGYHADYDFVVICVVLYVDAWLFLLDYMSCDGHIDDNIV